MPLPGVSEQELADAAQLASLSDETPEGRSIVVLAKERYGIRGRDMAQLQRAYFIPFSAHTRISGIDLEGEQIRKGAVDAVVNYVRQVTGNPNMPIPPELEREAERYRSRAARRSPSPATARLLGLVHLKDIVKGGIRERFAELRRMGIRTIMITGDNPLTAAAIAAEAGRGRFPGAGHAREQARTSSARSRPRASSSPCAATARTTRRRWLRPMSAWR